MAPPASPARSNDWDEACLYVPFRWRMPKRRGRSRRREKIRLTLFYSANYHSIRRTVAPSSHSRLCATRSTTKATIRRTCFESNSVFEHDGCRVKLYGRSNMRVKMLACAVASLLVQAFLASLTPWHAEASSDSADDVGNSTCSAIVESVSQSNAFHLFEGAVSCSHEER